MKLANLACYYYLQEKALPKRDEFILYIHIIIYNILGLSLKHKRRGKYNTITSTYTNFIHISPITLLYYNIALCERLITLLLLSPNKACKEKMNCSSLMLSKGSYIYWSGKTAMLPLLATGKHVHQDSHHSLPFNGNGSTSHSSSYNKPSVSTEHED